MACPLATTSPVTLPYTSSEISSQPYWGPDEAEVVWGPDMPYRLSYQIADGGDLSTGTVRTLPPPFRGNIPENGSNLRPVRHDR